MPWFTAVVGATTNNPDPGTVIIWGWGRYLVVAPCLDHEMFSMCDGLFRAVINGVYKLYRQKCLGNGDQHGLESLVRREL